MRILAEAINYSQKEILENTYDKKEWEELFAKYTPETTFNLCVKAVEIDRISINVYTGKNGKWIDAGAIYDTEMSEYLIGCVYTEGK